MASAKDNFMAILIGGIVALGGAGIRGLTKSVSKFTGHATEHLPTTIEKSVQKEIHPVTALPLGNKIASHSDALLVGAIRLASRQFHRFEDIADGTAPLNNDYAKPSPKKVPSSPTLPLFVDLRPFTNPIQDQGAEGTCTAYATAAAMETWFNSRVNKKVKLSEGSLWSLYKKPSALYALKSAAGDSQSFVSIASIDGQTVAKKKWSLVLDLPATRFGLKGTQEIIEQVAQKNPVLLATVVNQSFAKNKTGWIETHGEVGDDAHAVTVVGYRLVPEAPWQSYLIIRNSWGKDWGDHGYGYLPLRYCEKYKCIAHAITRVRFLDLEDLLDPGPVIR